MERKHTSTFGIKGKLISAVAMLLVAVIMVVSSTYAWFTLSTAPEVRGIQTAIGANGALEIRLNAGLDIIGKTDSVDAAGNPIIVDIKNSEYGNLIDLSDDIYGLENIILNPATLNYNLDKSVIKSDDFAKSTFVINTTNMLGFATYDKFVGDGRPGSLNYSTLPGTYNTDKGFVANTNTGVRAVGTSSGMTPEQLAYRSALGAASNAISKATTKAANSLSANGSILANAVVAYALDTNTTFDAADVAALRAIVTSFQGTDGILASVEEAYVKLFIGLTASKLGNPVAYEAAKNYVSLDEIVTVTYTDTTNKTVATVALKKIGEFDPNTAFANNNISDLLASIKAFYQTKANITAASAELTIVEAAVATEAVNWETFSAPLQYLVKSDKITVNGFTPAQLKTDAGQQDLMKDVANGKGINVAMIDGAGVYEEIADHCGNYTASIKLNVTYGSLELENINAKMSTKSTAPATAYLKTAQTALETAGMPVNESGNTDSPMSEFYGYVIDLAFRTNATSSDLLLQVDPADRIYKDNNNEYTQGGGSSMTFTSNSNDFSTANVATLMSYIRIVFFDTTSGEVYAFARLDTAAGNYTVGANADVTAKMYLCDVLGNKLTDSTGAITKIVSLPQNVEKQVSVLVYLEGGNSFTYGDTTIPLLGVDNSKVPSTANVTGKMNLQFGSSATLVPMEYGDLHTPGETESSSEAES